MVKIIFYNKFPLGFQHFQQLLFYAQVMIATQSVLNRYPYPNLKNMFL